MRKMKKLLIVVAIMFTVLGCCGWGWLDSLVQELCGTLIGNEYDITFYDNYGAKFLTVEGDRIDINGNKITETIFSDTGLTTTNSLSSVITITIDGHEIESCGDTVIFAGEGLTPVVDFSLNEMIKSSSDGLSGLTSVNRVLNKYENFFGKKRVVLIQSQLGVPICAFSGDDVYWEVPSDLPKMTKLSIDGKPLYIHRANYQIIDASLIN